MRIEIYTHDDDDEEEDALILFFTNYFPSRSFAEMK
jgi:ubiquitin